MSSNADEAYTLLKL